MAQVRNISADARYLTVGPRTFHVLSGAVVTIADADFEGVACQPRIWEVVQEPVTGSVKRNTRPGEPAMPDATPEASEPPTEGDEPA